MLPDRVSNPGPLTYESGALPIALCGPAMLSSHSYYNIMMSIHVYSVYDSIRNLYLYISVSSIAYSLYLFHL